MDMVCADCLRTMGEAEWEEHWCNITIDPPKPMVTVLDMTDVAVTVGTVEEVVTRTVELVDKLVADEPRGPHRAYRLAFMRSAKRSLEQARSFLAEARAFEDEEEEG